MRSVCSSNIGNEVLCLLLQYTIHEILKFSGVVPEVDVVSEVMKGADSTSAY